MPVNASFSLLCKELKTRNTQRASGTDPAIAGGLHAIMVCEQVLLPLSGMGSWMLVVSGALMSMHVLGINLTPLLTVGGISGIVVGLSAQALLGNMISGLNLVRSDNHTNCGHGV